jgi:hypothetical protein
MFVLPGGGWTGKAWAANTVLDHSHTARIPLERDRLGKQHEMSRAVRLIAARDLALERRFGFE